MSTVFFNCLKFLISALVVVFICLGIAVIRTLNLPNLQKPQSCFNDDQDFIPDSRGLSKRLSEAIKFETICIKEHTYNREALSKLIFFISKSFPRMHSSPIVTKEIVNNHSLLYHIKGSNKSLKPYLLAGHLDVVPVEESKWEVPPFSGEIKDDFIWGRGTIDCKHIVMGVLEAVEFLLEKNYKPKRSLYLAFGHDEECNGLDGARQISKLLASRNVQLEYLLDEGTMVIEKLFPGINIPLALVSVSEKGSLNMELTVNDKPGHSSFPRRETAIVILAKAVSKLEGDVFPSMFGTGPEENMLQELAYCEVPFPLKVALSNMWLFRHIIPLFMNSPALLASRKTTTAVTIISGGYKVNVLPSVASASVNLRIHPGQTISQVIFYLKSIINDERVELKVLSQSEPHPVSPIDTFGYSTIKKSIQQIYNDSCVVPTLLIANTDTKWYLNLTSSIYRFSLARMTMAETSRFHGHNERISIKNYGEVVNFFLHLIKNSDVTEDRTKHVHDDL